MGDAEVAETLSFSNMYPNMCPSYYFGVLVLAILSPCTLSTSAMCHVIIHISKVANQSSTLAKEAAWRTWDGERGGDVRGCRCVPANTKPGESPARASGMCLFLW